METCGVYFRGDAVYVIASARTVPGILISSEPMFKLGRADPPRVIGEAVLAALDSFREGVPMPEDYRSVTGALVKFTGFKTWNAFARSASHLPVVRRGGEVEVIPTLRSQGGFDHLPDKALKSPPEAEAVGQTLFEALKLCS